MLVLSRHAGETLYIGEGENRIRVTVVSVDRGKVRLGIEAPQSLPIYREELEREGQGPSSDPRTRSENLPDNY